MRLHALNIIARAICLIALIATSASCSDRDLIPVQVYLSRSVYKLPYIIALDQGIYEKYGLDLEIRMGPPDFPGGIHMPSNHLAARIWRRLQRMTGTQPVWNPDISTASASHEIFDMASNANTTPRVFIAATDCLARAHIVAAHDVQRLEDLQGKRLGILNFNTNSGFVALLLAERMGWSRNKDLSIVINGNNIDALRDGRVDAIVSNERSYAQALAAGYTVLASTSSWNEPMAGYSVSVDPEWLGDRKNRDIARRFLQATIEGIALFHQDRELVLQVLAKWHGITDRDNAQTVYEDGRRIPRKPYPCYKGIDKALKLYNSAEYEEYQPGDLYDDSLIRELDENGFIDSLYSVHE